MWTRLSIQNFRLLRDVTIDFEPGKPVVLIGPNASGKSSVLQVLELLHRCATVGHDAAARGLGAFASASAFASDPENAARIESSLDTVDASEWRQPELRHLHHILETMPRGGLVHESLSATTSSAGDAVKTELLHWDAADALTLQNTQSRARDALENPSGKLSFELVRQGSFYPYLEVLRDALSGIRTYGGFLTTPLWDRAPSETKVSVADAALLAPEQALERRGLNLINVLYQLKNGDDSGAWRELMQAFQGEFPFVKDLVFPAERGGRVSLGCALRSRGLHPCLHADRARRSHREAGSRRAGELARAPRGVRASRPRPPRSLELRSRSALLMTKILVLWEDAYHGALDRCVRRAIQHLGGGLTPLELYFDDVRGNGGFTPYVQQDWPIAASRGLAKSRGPIDHLLCVADADRAHLLKAAGARPSKKGAPARDDALDAASRRSIDRLCARVPDLAALADAILARMPLDPPAA